MNRMLTVNWEVDRIIVVWKYPKINFVNEKEEKTKFSLCKSSNHWCMLKFLSVYHLIESKRTATYWQNEKLLIAHFSDRKTRRRKKTLTFCPGECRSISQYEIKMFLFKTYSQTFLFIKNYSIVDQFHLFEFRCSLREQLWSNLYQWDQQQ